MNTRHFHNNKGMTLLEVMITIGLLSMVGAGLTATLIGSVRGWRSGVSKDNAVSDVTIAMQKLSMEIRDGRSAGVSNNVLTVTFPNTITEGSESIYDLSTAGSVTRSYYMSDGNLVRNVGGSVSILGRGVVADFGTTTGGAVSVTLSSQNSDETGTPLSVRGKISLRNYRD
ncbi:prepilin-type N-terminal cleavage/methylation domain-containing protein [bacterium]|nr:prepilin-type N-terminal cleavage/methylation domain-containing protein [bacterium]